MPFPPHLLLTAITAVLTMSLVPVLIKSVAANEVTIGLGRLFIALLCISPLVFARAGFAGLNRRAWLGLLVIGLCFGLHWLAYFYSIKTAGAAVAAIAVSTYGVHLLLLNSLFKGHKVTALEWALILVCVFGCYLVVPSVNLADTVTLGLLAGLFSAVLYAAMPLLHQRVAEVPTLTRAWGQFAFAALFFLPFWGLSDWQLGRVDYFKLLALGLVCTVVAHGLWVKASTELPPVFTAVIYYLYVPMAMLLSALFLDELISLPMATGATLIISANIGLALISWRALKRTKLNQLGE
ncbi:MAG: DMT family transporter [Cellvibrionaceae bacterium]|nr:DMT family transporter [Cellvibrionaceae bacterium]MCV6624834.1 DMT family transporter [Cellvibrionaceae bacterium]